MYELLLANMKKWQKAYDEGHPEISDIEWDDYYTTLLTIEKNQGFADPESPSQKIHYDVVNELKKVEHNHPMLSLDKTKDIEEIKSFISNHDWICMAKMDGLTCSLHYRGGRLVRAETRGNGVVGEDITHNAYKIPSIPKTIDSNYDTVVDGEIICTYENFEKFNKDYSNPRNFASGSIRLLDAAECAKRGLEFVAWDCDIKDGHETLVDKVLFFADNNFTWVPFEYGNTLEDCVTMIKRKCQELNYPIDGVVFKYNNCEEYAAAGQTAHHFKGGLAYKFYDETYKTKLRNIEWSLGRTGVLTPIAVFDEVVIDGAKISRASLHNLSVLDNLLGTPVYGQELEIYRAN
jgi:DNA ligase (NAD+)